VNSACMQKKLCGLDAEDLRVAYGEHVALDLKEVRLRGNIIALIGHNGAGKSTLIKTILKLLRPLGGRLSAWCDQDGVKNLLIPERDMAFCPENGAVFADISVESYIRLWCRIKLGQPNHYLKAGRRYIDTLEIAPLLPKLGRELSKGQRRRVQTVVGLLSAPRLFLVDEPFCGLDVQKTNDLANFIFEMSQDMSFILASHRMDVIERLADCVLVLKHGSLVTCGSVKEVALDLCRKSARITNVSNPDGLFAALKQRFGACLINRHAEEISVSGMDFEIEDLGRFVQSVDANGARISAIAPGLVDALNFHLKQVSCSLSGDL
jgi:ABC-2 type transport system ATP-binding protein